ncbi:unnamed protein product [Cylindrotheca closterium]|uniref:Uncharacterized protein n=1 Tax=Cylindrotheca closterium TaxID=2856 RepID=A0AAD2CE10_9STRA|nr:unnamed protein product [Cylindrotheca closterium]
MVQNEQNEAVPSTLTAPIAQRAKMPDQSMIESFHRCGISSSCNNCKKRNQPYSPIRIEMEGESGRPRSRQRLESFQCDDSDGPGSAFDPVGAATTVSASVPPVRSRSLVVFQPPSYGRMVSPSSSCHTVVHQPPAPAYYPIDTTAQTQVWVPRPPPASYDGNPQ